MLKNKLATKVTKMTTINSSETTDDITENTNLTSINNSVHFNRIPLWQSFYELECILNLELKNLTASKSITHIYNPIEYACELHCNYLRSFLDGPKKLIFIGMNPGANGMGQTGIPFGNIRTVRDLMGLTGTVLQPSNQHPKRPIKGFETTIEEPSGVRIWSLFKRLANDSLETFSRQCYVHNFCPLVFFDLAGHNITPSELKGDYKADIRDVCLSTLDKQISLLQPEIIVAVGEYVFSTLKRSKHAKNITVLRLAHPSPRSLNNTNWPEKAEKWLIENDLLKYIRNEAT